MIYTKTDIMQKLNLTQNKTLTVIISYALILLNIYIFHRLGVPADVINITSIIFISIIIGKNQNFGAITKSFLLFGCFAVNDIGIKLYSGGDHDVMRRVWIYLMYLIEIIIATAILTWSIISNTKDSKENKWISVLLFPLLTILHLTLTFQLGQGRSFPLHVKNSYTHIDNNFLSKK